MTAPHLEVDLAKVEHNARHLVQRLGRRGIRVTGVTKVALGAPEVAAAMERGGVLGLGDSRVQNLRRLRLGGSTLPRTLIRSPLLSEVDAVVAEASVSLNSEAVVVRALGDAAERRDVAHGVIVMVELGDLREGASPGDVPALAALVERHAHLTLEGLGTNLGCQSGIAPDDRNMQELSALVDQVEAQLGRRLSTISGGNSAALPWAVTCHDLGRIDELRLGEAIVVGTEPLHRTAIPGLHSDACVLFAEVIEAQTKPAQPWGTVAQGAFGEPPARSGTGHRRQALVAIGHQDTDPAGLTPPPGCAILGASSDHLVLDVTAAETAVAVGDQLAFHLDYSALLRAMTSPFVDQRFSGDDAPMACVEPPRRGGQPPWPGTTR